MRVVIISILILGSFMLSAATGSAAGICDCCGCKDCVVAFYFHTNMRCATCKAIEQYTKEVVDSSFDAESQANKLCFQVINTEVKDNEHYTADYQLYTKAVILSLVRNGKQVKFVNLTKIWELTKNEEAFKKYIADEITKYLKEL